MAKRTLQELEVAYKKLVQRFKRVSAEKFQDMLRFEAELTEKDSTILDLRMKYEEEAQSETHIMSLDVAEGMSVNGLSLQGVFIHRKLGEMLNDKGYKVWSTEKEKAFFLTGGPVERAKILHRHLRDYATGTPGGHQAMQQRVDVAENLVANLRLDNENLRVKAMGLASDLEATKKQNKEFCTTIARQQDDLAAAWDESTKLQAAAEAHRGLENALRVSGQVVEQLDAKNETIKKLLDNYQYLVEGLVRFLPKKT